MARKLNLRGWVVIAVLVFFAGFVASKLAPRPLFDERPAYLEGATHAAPLTPRPPGHDAP